METRLDSVLNTMASSMSAESIRMNVTASNLANSGAVGSSDAETYHAKHPVFSTIAQALSGINQSDQSIGGVRVSDIIQNEKPLTWRYEPDNPLADKNGRVYLTDVNPLEEMTDLISASRQYQASAEVTTTTKKLLLDTIQAIGD
jgi:flagellar basal-body rod protein FlgC